jgi:hypothetical protein
LKIIKEKDFKNLIEWWDSMSYIISLKKNLVIYNLVPDVWHPYISYLKDIKFLIRKSL